MLVSATDMSITCKGAVAIVSPICCPKGATLAAMAKKGQEVDAEAALKLASRAWSTGTLEAGKQVIDAQQVKLEDDAEIMALAAQLQDMCASACVLACLIHLLNFAMHQDLKRRRAEMGSPAAPSPPPVMPPGSQASLNTPMKVAKKAALASVDEILPGQDDDTIPATQLTPGFTPLKQKQLFEVTCPI